MMESNEKRPDVDEEEQSAADALRDLLTQMSELQAYATHFLSAKVDGMQLAVRQTAIWMALGIVGLIAAAGALITAIVLLLTGVAQGLAIAFGDRVWLGSAVTGLGLLILIAIVFFVGIRRQRRQSYNRRKQAYDERQLQQRVAFGRNAADHAADATL